MNISTGQSEATDPYTLDNNGMDPTRVYAPTPTPTSAPEGVSTFDGINTLDQLNKENFTSSESLRVRAESVVGEVQDTFSGFLGNGTNRVVQAGASLEVATGLQDKYKIKLNDVIKEYEQKNEEIAAQSAPVVEEPTITFSDSHDKALEKPNQVSGEQEPEITFFDTHDKRNFNENKAEDPFSKHIVKELIDRPTFGNVINTTNLDRPVVEEVKTPTPSTKELLEQIKELKERLSKSGQPAVPVVTETLLNTLREGDIGLPPVETATQNPGAAVEVFPAEPVVPEVPPTLVQEQAPSLPSSEFPPEMEAELGPDKRTRVEKIKGSIGDGLRKIFKEPAKDITFALGNYIKRKTAEKVDGVIQTFLHPGYKIGMLFQSALITSQKEGWIFSGNTIKELNDRGGKLEIKITGLQKTIDVLKGEQEKADRENLPRLIVENFQTRIEKLEGQKSELVRKVGEIQGLKDSVQTRIDTYKKTREGFAKEINTTIEGSLSSINQKLQPINSLLKGPLGLEQVVENLQNLISRKEQDLKAIIEKISPDKNLKGLYEPQIKLIREKLSTAKKIHAQKSAELVRIQRKANGFSSRVRVWDDVRNKWGK